MAACGPPTVTLTIAGPLEHADLPVLLERTCALLGGAGGGRLRCEIRDVTADALALEALARLALAARRRGWTVSICGASRALGALISVAGLADVLTLERPESVEYGGSAGVERS
jgi:ABC-type transporter Mla MlaB component